MSASIEGLTVHQSIFASQTDFLQDWHVRVSWIAFFTLWVIWGLIWTIRSYFTGATTSTEPTPANADDIEPATGKKFSISARSLNGSFAARLDNAHQIVKDSLFSLLCLLILNTFARASTRAVMILAWFYVAFAVVWFIAELIVDSRYMRVIYTLIFYSLGLAIGGLAFKQGFY